MEQEKQTFGISSLILKIIACVLMTLDHVALLFLPSPAVLSVGPYYILRAIGKIAFPIFAFLAVEGVYHTKNIKGYLLRLLIGALLIDLFGYIISFSTGISIASNPIIGNAFMDLFLGVLLVYLLKRKDWYSLFAILPFLYALFSEVEIHEYYGTLFKADWGFFSICLFALFFLARELGDYYLKKKALREGLEENTYLLLDSNKYHKILSVFALVTIELVFYLIFRLDNTSFLLPNQFVPLGTYSTLALLFILLYNGKRGFSSKVLQFSFYAYYPLHVFILGIISLFVGTLASVL